MEELPDAVIGALPQQYTACDIQQAKPAATMLPWLVSAYAKDQGIHGDDGALANQSLLNTRESKNSTQQQIEKTAVLHTSYLVVSQ